jgi:hypothetical protein
MKKGKPPKSSFELAMERLRAADPASEEKRPLSTRQKEEIAEVRRTAAARVAEREILFQDALKQTHDPAEREKLEGEYQIDRKRIDDDCERNLEAIRRGR